MTTISLRLSEPGTLIDGGAAIPGVWRRVMRRVASTWCLINGGHYKVLHTAADRMALRCVSCGHMSPGWEVGNPRLIRAAAANPARLRARRTLA